MIRSMLLLAAIMALWWHLSPPEPLLPPPPQREETWFPSKTEAAMGKVMHPLQSETNAPDR